MPGAVISIQTFGDLVNFHPHLHCLVSDGCFMPNGWFYVLPEIDVKKLESLFRHKVLKLLLREKKISREWVEKLLSGETPGSISIIRSKSEARTRLGWKRRDPSLVSQRSTDRRFIPLREWTRNRRACVFAAGKDGR